MAKEPIKPVEIPHESPAEIPESTPVVAVPEELTADEIIAKQVAEAKAAGKEYQGREPSVKDLAVEKKIS